MIKFIQKRERTSLDEISAKKLGMFGDKIIQHMIFPLYYKNNETTSYLLLLHTRFNEPFEYIGGVGG